MRAMTATVSLKSLFEYLELTVTDVLFLAALLASVWGHYVWLSGDDGIVTPVSSGGRPNTALAVAVSWSAPATAQSQPEPVITEPVKAEKVNKEKGTVVSEAAPAVTAPQTLAEVQEPLKRQSASEQKPVVATQDLHSEALPQPLSPVPVVREVEFHRAPEPPVYPSLSLRRRQQGEVLVHALVNEQGETEEVALIRSSGFSLLDHAAIDAVSGWSFVAAKVNGQAIKAWVEVPVAFQIN